MIAEANKQRSKAEIGNFSDKVKQNTTKEGRVYPDCRNASNPYHECNNYCFKIIVEAKKQRSTPETGLLQAKTVDVKPHLVRGEDVPYAFFANRIYQLNETRKANQTAIVAEKKKAEALPESRGMSEQKLMEESKKKTEKLLNANGLDMNKAYMLDTRESVEAKYKQWEKAPARVGCDGLLQAKAVDVKPHLLGGEYVLDVSWASHIYQNEARKTNQTAMLVEKKKTEALPESRGMSKQKLMEESKKKSEKLLDANGLDMSKAYMLDTRELVEAKYKKWEKAPAPASGDVFNQKYDAYNKMKEADSEFYKEASSLQYGKAPKISNDNTENNMVKELKDRDEKRQSMIHPNIIKLAITRLKEFLHP